MDQPHCNSNGCELARLKLPGMVLNPCPSSVTALFFGCTCIQPHLVQVPAQPYLLPNRPFNLCLEWFIGDTHRLTMRMETHTRVLRFVSQGKANFYTVLMAQPSTHLNLLLTERSCNAAGGWYGNTLVFAHQPLPYRGNLNGLQPSFLRHVSADDVEDIYFRIRSAVECNFIRLHPLPAAYYPTPWSCEGFFHNVPNEIVYLILRHLAFADLFNLSVTARRIRATCQYLAERTIKRFLIRFFPSRIEEFIADMLQTETIIFGEVVTWLYLAPAFETDPPTEFNIAVRLSEYHVLHSRLTSMSSFVRSAARNLRGQYSDTADSCVEFIFNTFALPRSIFVFIADAPDVFDIITSASTTAELMMLTGAHLMVLTPDEPHMRSSNPYTTIRNPILTGWGGLTNTPESLNIGGIEFQCFDSNMHWATPCGKCCPALRRRIGSWAHHRLCQWSKVRADRDRIMETISESGFAWQLIKKCPNEVCNHRTYNAVIPDDVWLAP